MNTIPQRTCKYCSNTYDITEFEEANTIKGKTYRRWKCRSCYRDQKKARRQLIRQKLEEYKAGKECARCGFDNPKAFQFHHNGDKEIEVSNAVRLGWSWEHILREISKCEILCANCHQIETTEVHYAQK